MDYIDYLKKKFDIEDIDYEVVQHVLEKSYNVKVNDICYIIYFEALLSFIQVDYKTLYLSTYFNYLKIENERKLYKIDISSNDITKVELFYILYILYSKFSMEISKKDIDEILKHFD